MSELPDLSLLTSAQKDELVRHLFGQVKAFSAQVSLLSAQIEQFKAKQNQDYLV